MGLVNYRNWNRSILASRIEIARQDQLQSHFVRRTGQAKPDAAFDIEDLALVVKDSK
jgi:hypothetical protein